MNVSFLFEKNKLEYDMGFINKKINLLLHLNKNIIIFILKNDKSKTWSDIYGLAYLSVAEVLKNYDNNKSSFIYFWNKRFKSYLIGELRKLNTEKRKKENQIYYKNSCYSTINIKIGLQNLLEDVYKLNILTDLEKRYLSIYIKDYDALQKPDRKTSHKKILSKLKTNNINFNSVIKCAKRKIRKHFNIKDYAEIVENNFDYIVSNRTFDMPFLENIQ